MPIILYTSAEASFARPGDTTAYAANDQVANSTTAGSVVPLSWTNAQCGGLLNQGKGFLIIGALLRKSSVGVTNPSFRIHLYSAIPTIATAGDNATFGNVTGRANLLGSLSATFTTPHADGCLVTALPTENGEIRLIPARAANGTLYGMIEAAAAYAPGNAETFGVRLLIGTEDQ